MEELISSMMKQLGSESAAEENGTTPPDMPDLGKLISTVTNSMMGNPNMQKLLSGGTHVQTNKPKLLRHQLNITLEDIYNGTDKIVKMKRQVYDVEKNKNVWEKTTVPVNIGRGMRFGHTIVVPDVGDLLKDKEPGDLEIVIGMDSVHNILTAEDDNLVLNVTVPVHNMFHFVYTYKHLDDRNITLYYSNDDVPLRIGKYKVHEMGLPCEDGAFGDLIIHVNFEFPSNLFELQNIKPVTEVSCNKDDAYALLPVVE